MAHITDEMLKDKFGITIKSEFVPWSKSRSFKAGTPTMKKNLNWKVTLCKDEREIITVDYSAGIAHAPSYKNYQPRIHGSRASIAHTEYLEHEVEKGTDVTVSHFGKGKPILPETSNVVYALLMDSEAIEYSTFEEWADAFGYDPDSRKGEAIYRQCLEIGLKMRAGLGDSTLAQLRELFQDF
jgi:hypothetical protein